MSNFTQYKVKFNNDTGVRADSNIPLYLLYIECAKNGIIYNQYKSQFFNETGLSADANKETYLNWIIANFVNGGSGATLPREKRTEWVSLLLMYQGFAPQGSLESDAVWTIYKIVTLATGGVVSNTEFTNKKWTERNLI